MARSNSKRSKALAVATALLLAAAAVPGADSFVTPGVGSPAGQSSVIHTPTVLTAQHVQLSAEKDSLLPCFPASLEGFAKGVTTTLASAVLAFTFFMPFTSHAENELSDKYGGKGFDTSLVDQTCLVDRCSAQAKACLADDPSCRKGLTCTAKCLGDNACITGCMARYGDKNLDNLLKCTIEDHECIKIAILPGGGDAFGSEPKAPAPTVKNFDASTLAGTWFKVAGFNPNYDCYACQRNTFKVPAETEMQRSVSIEEGISTPSVDRLEMAVEFSMPHLLPDGSPPPPKNVRESITVSTNPNTGAAVMFGSKSIGLNEYQTNEVMVFDQADSKKASPLVLNKGTDNEVSYARTAHSEGEMFGLKFWENWYIIGENEPDQPEFKFVYYNGKTRQNTYEGAFVYSRNKNLEPESMQKVYQIAKSAGMNPDQFCRIRNGCFNTGAPNIASAGNEAFTPLFREQPSDPTFRGFLASTRVSELLGVEAVSAREDTLIRALSQDLQPIQQRQPTGSRPWWYEVGDYLENPHRHFEAMDKLRQPMDWSERK